MRLRNLFLNAQRILLTLLTAANVWEAQVQLRRNSLFGLLYAATAVSLMALLIGTWPRRLD